MPKSGGTTTVGMAAVSSDDSLKARIQYLARDDQHQLVKPYYLYFKYDSDIAPTNTSPDDRFVQICNARNLGVPPREMFFEWGFAQLRLDCPLTPEEYCYDKKVEEVLYPKYKTIAQFLFPNAARVEVLEHAVRIRHPLWLSEGIERHDLKTNQPSDYVHIENYIQELTLHFTSFWKPIKGPVYDFPLTLCDRRTIDYESQATAMDIVTNVYVNENTRLYFNEKHKWYYWHGLQVDEVIAFIQADSQAENRAGMMDFTPIE
ncbi:hypothetical protein N7462_010268 [Penicillium macrosclerotiorum]|uniref:uncharacterized protein n=1 Tax=Penicillium macrosclerotiorum TaxID=303699 RepID=UPI002548CC1D|nr:uncharacterized protein N7462_010268 [Penicillium macrosclerotiorum]KAJ5669198.1 hypothetical protein N7462_010268 [Penicillium macrosclerotiorum]